MKRHVLYFIALSQVLIFFTAKSFAQSSSLFGEVECAVQLVRANTEHLEVKPRLLSERPVTMKRINAQNRFGQVTHAFDIEDHQGVFYQVEIQVRLQDERSTWVKGHPRMWVSTQVRNRHTGNLIMSGEEHSDNILREHMVGLLERVGPRVVFMTYNPTALDKLSRIQDTDVQKALQTQGSEHAINLAYQKGLIPALMPYRVDTVCLTPDR